MSLPSLLHKLWTPLSTPCGRPPIPRLPQPLPLVDEPLKPVNSKTIHLPHLPSTPLTTPQTTPDSPKPHPRPPPCPSNSRQAAPKPIQSHLAPPPTQNPNPPPHHSHLEHPPATQSGIERLTRAQSPKPAAAPERQHQPDPFAIRPRPHHTAGTPRQLQRAARMPEHHPRPAHSRHLAHSPLAHRWLRASPLSPARQPA